MADYAGTIGNTFNIPLNQAQPSGIDPYVMQQMQQIQQPGPKTSSPEDGLYEVEGLTKEYYDKWAAVNEFAQNMWGQGIDITKPDPFNPQSQSAHRWYLKALADLERHGNSLKNSQKALEQYTTAKLSDRGADIGLVDSFDSNRDLLSSFDIVNRGQTDLVNRTNTDLAKTTNDPAELKALNAQISEKQGLLKTQLADMIMDGANEAQIAEKVNEINSLNKATYNDTTRWQERQQNARAAKAKEKDPTDFTRVELVQRVLNGDYDLLKANPKVQSTQFINTPRRKGIMVKAQGLDEPKFIDFNKADPGILNDINEMLNYGQEGKAVSTDDFTRLLKEYPNDITTPSSPDLSEAEELFINSLSTRGRFQSKEAAQVMLREARPNMQMPTSVSGKDFNYYIKKMDFDYGGSGKIKFTLQDDKGEPIKGGSEVIIDLNTEAGKDQFQKLIDDNAEYLDYGMFAPEPNKLGDNKQYIPSNLKGGTNIEQATKLIDLL